MREELSVTSVAIESIRDELSDRSVITVPMREELSVTSVAIESIREELSDRSVITVPMREELSVTSVTIESIREELSDRSVITVPMREELSARSDSSAIDEPSTEMLVAVNAPTLAVPCTSSLYEGFEVPIPTKAVL